MKTYRIVPGGLVRPGEFLLIDPGGTVVRTDPRPRRLADWAFDQGADWVRHEYDLRLAEER